MQRGLPTVVTLVVACLPVAAAPGMQDAAAAVELTPDQVEAFVEARSGWFEKLQAFVNGAEPTVLGEDVVFVAPAAEADEWLEGEAGELLVVRSYGAARAAVEPEAWLGRFVRGEVFPGECDVATKVVGATRDAGGMVLDVRIEVRGVEELGMPPVWQATAEARASFDGEDRCMRLDLVSFERAQLDTPYFTERTAGVFNGAVDLAELLAVGLDRLATRLDDPALTAWFGHQGLAAGDINGDGRTDLYVGMPAGIPNLLLVQQANGQVVDEAIERGVAWLDDTKGVMLVDMDGDGDDDVVSALGHVIVIQDNKGPGLFRVSGRLVAPDEASFYSIAAADINDDRVPEIYGTRYVTTRYADAVPVPFHEARNGPSNHLFQKKGGEWKDITEKAGLAEEGGRFSLSAQFVDANGDGRLDLYVVNDFGSNQLFEQQRRWGTFKAVESPINDAGAGMGAAWGDVDGDDDIDLYVTNMYSSAGRRTALQSTFGEGLEDAARERVRGLASGNALYLSDGEGNFERAEGARVAMGRWGWGGQFSDFDGDGLLDIVVPAGFLTGPKPGDL